MDHEYKRNLDVHQLNSSSLLSASQTVINLGLDTKQYVFESPLDPEATPNSHWLQTHKFED